MISDMYAVHPRVPSSMTSSNSANSFDFVAVLDRDECQLLSESISMGSLWSIDSDDTVPPFPDRPTAPITPMLLDDRSMLHPRGRSKTERDDYKILTTVATPPRMKDLLLETLRVDLWVDTTIIRVAPPGHIPWEAATHVTECSWVPSGSLYPPNMFKQALQSSRHADKGRPSVAATFGSIEPKMSRSRSSSQQGSFRKALVFEHEMTLSTGGKNQRWSFQVPADTMNPEMVDMMLELQDLNSFFKGSLNDLEESVTVLGEEKDKLDPPSLMISDSHCAFPISLESSAHLQRGPPIPLAARRGKTLLPPLSLTEKRVENSYPSIPTAFLGSPSTYSPKFEYANAQDDPSLDLENMITNLRSQCDYPQRADHTDLELAVESPISVMSFAAPSDQENTDDDDDWAFAISFLDEFGSQVPDLDQGQNGDHQNSGIKSQNTEGDLGAGGDLLANGPSTPRAQNPAYSPPRPIPSAPLPATPAMRATPVGHTSSSSGVRGILKSCKNVRFASLPGKPEEEKINTEPSPTTTPTVAPSVTLPPDRASRPRTYSRSSKQLKENATILVTPRSYRPASAYVAAGVKTEKTRPLYIAPSPTLDPLQSKKAASSGRNRSPPRPSARHSAAPVRRSAPISMGRQSLGRTVKAEPQQENENKGGTFPRSKANLRWTMNDMTFRRGSNASQQTPEGTPKSRMPVPLRNILTRFK